MGERIFHAALIHWCDERNETDCSLDMLLQASWRLMYLNYIDQGASSKCSKPFLDLVDYECIAGQIYVVEEAPDIRESRPPIPRVMEIAPRSQWCYIFLNEEWYYWIRNLYQKKKQKDFKNKFIGYNGCRYSYQPGKPKRLSDNYLLSNPIGLTHNSYSDTLGDKHESELDSESDGSDACSNMGNKRQKGDTTTHP